MYQVLKEKSEKEKETQERDKNTFILSDPLLLACVTEMYVLLLRYKKQFILTSQ